MKAAGCVRLAKGAWLLGLASVSLVARPDAGTGAAGVPTAAGSQASLSVLVERGRYLAAAGDCVSCHSAPGRPAFAGGLPLKTPFGTIISTNITPDAEAGIGRYTLADFSRALRQGKGRDGRNLYPAMPYVAYARITDADIEALFAYFRQGVAASPVRAPKTELPWPFSMRSLLTFWNWIYLDKITYTADASKSAEWNRGAYLVQGLGHCGDCHTPRGVLGGVKAADERHGESYLAGAVIDGWLAQPLRHGDRASAAMWPTADLVEYFKTGRLEHTAAFGPMSEVVENSMQYLSHADLTAVATYLQSIGKPGAPPPRAQAALVAEAAAHPSSLALQNATASRKGAALYLDNCNACHRSSGTGASRVFPALPGNSVVSARDATSLIRIVLTGSAMPATQTAPAALGMPGFAWRLADDEVAELLSFIRASWGNHAEPVTARDVAAVRKGLPPKG